MEEEVPVGNFRITLDTPSNNVEQLQETIAKMSYLIGFISASINHLMTEVTDDKLRGNIAKLSTHLDECVEVLFYPEQQEEEIDHK